MGNMFSSSKEYKKTFNDGLLQLAQDESLGTFILAMANATFDEEIYKVTKDLLKTNFLRLQSKYIESFTEGRKVNEVDEDLLVFMKMLCVSFEKLQTTVFREEAG